MSLIFGESITLMAGSKTLFEQANFVVEKNYAYGLIGPNGSGKSTFCKMLTQSLLPDKGQINFAKNLQISLLKQDFDFPLNETIIHFVKSKVQKIKALNKQKEYLESALALAVESQQDADIMRLSESYANLQEDLNLFENQFGEHQAKKILVGLGFADKDFNKPLKEFSGGWRMRAELAGLLFSQPDVLLLDEPTNHLDLPSVAWLSKFLKSYAQPFILISHDLDFLDPLVNSIFSIEPEGLRTYKGNYSNYLKQRKLELEVQEREIENFAKQQAHDQKFVDRFKAKASKAKAAHSKQKNIDRRQKAFDEKQLAQSYQFNQSIVIPEASRINKRVLEVSGFEKSYGDLLVFKDLDFVVEAGDKIGIIGPNGAGKSTLLKILAEKINQNSGTFQWAHQTKWGYFSQSQEEELDPELSALENLTMSEFLINEMEARKLLGALGLSGEDSKKPTSVLSGGERSRVALAKLFSQENNVLLLDEPTNHLDIWTSEALGKALNKWNGTCIFVSHNQSFIKNVATQIWDMRDQGFNPFLGTLKEYCDKFANASLFQKTRIPIDEINILPKNKKDSRKEKAKQRELQNKELKPLEKQITATQTNIDNLESLKKELENELNDPGFYQKDAEHIKKINTDYQTTTLKLDELTDIWLDLEEQKEEILKKFS